MHGLGSRSPLAKPLPCLLFKAMKIRAFARRLVLVSVLAFSVVFGTAGVAAAGTLRIDDEQHMLANGEAERLKAVVNAAPFDAKLAFTAAYPDSQDLSQY